MTSLLIGTEDGIRTLDGPVARAGSSAAALDSDGSTWWALLDGRRLVGDATTDPGDTGDGIPVPDPLRGTCLLASPDGVLVGTSEARLLRLEDDSLLPVEGFDRTSGRDGWYTPWGGPPDTRSLARDMGGTLFVNVHVGGIPVSSDGGSSFEPTIDVDADVHQVIAHPIQAGRALAAAAIGLAETTDGGRTWDVTDSGLHAPYCRAVAVAGDTVLVSASTGPRGNRSALYRRPLDGDGPFERCTAGLPEWFDGNIDSHCLVAADGFVAFGTADGRVFVSDDTGSTWSEGANGLPPVRCLAVEAG